MKTWSKMGAEGWDCSQKPSERTSGIKEDSSKSFLWHTHSHGCSLAVFFLCRASVSCRLWRALSRAEWLAELRIGSWGWWRRGHALWSCRDASASCGWIYRVAEERMSFLELCRAWDRARRLTAINSARCNRACFPRARSLWGFAGHLG